MATDDDKGHMVSFTAEQFMQFKLAYSRAVVQQRDSFVFEGNVYLVTYAKYVIEYLKKQFP